MTPTAPDRPQPLFRRIRRAWADAPAVVQVLAVAALYFGFLTLIDFAGWNEVGFVLLLRAGLALVFGALMIGSRRIRGRRWARTPSWVEVSEAAEDGELPAGADPGAWLAALERRRAEIRQEASLVPIALVAVVALTFLNGASGDRAVAGIVFLAVFVSWAAVLIVSRGRRRDAVDALLIPLQEQAHADGERRAGWAPPSPGDRIPPAAG
ncbi:hypothetical protein [Clavibacter michiganensis]|uniref:Uncharacterized protein n=2 Tax=Clavibacter michiganensis subsp. insidiosus TaxID=33014 RepID=A0A0D5CJ07_9MICO|nr:hypothetical protein [Clavibacter michiganensis]AJW79222.1 hypothetical protein VO01_08865 [Clavibacter michiganensis subsp. insidiosus]AWF98058.1 hypothetical protein BEH61_06010 [Clavibacter michiganensis subsp. insidiosus]AWG01742.1 hypothetical protein BEH62_09065 [Clavibacter michiganensis subsp. insidiosus]OQJ59743.1 hypothetical protein B5P21_07360 [Clavibacter michiganensis subsp. insidiosus]RII85044.1 hypothetical protein DZF92_15815 [Clavibacter michiganensis subsp. insidiosus]